MFFHLFQPQLTSFHLVLTLLISSQRISALPTSSQIFSTCLSSFHLLPLLLNSSHVFSCLLNSSHLFSDYVNSSHLFPHVSIEMLYTHKLLHRETFTQELLQCDSMYVVFFGATRYGLTFTQMDFGAMTRPKPP